MTRRICALVTTVWFLAFGVLAASHEARVAHFVDGHTGQVLHATAMVGEHTGHTSDIHAVDVTPDHDMCSIGSTLHQSSRPSVAQLAVVANLPHPIVHAAPAARVALASQAVYQLAPKTSPPVA